MEKDINSILLGLLTDPNVDTDSVGIKRLRKDLSLSDCMDLLGGGVLPDWMIAKYIHIQPMVTLLNEKGVISYGLGSYGYDFRLGYNFKFIGRQSTLDPVIDPKNFNEKTCSRSLHSTEPVLIPPHQFVLAESLEWISMPSDVLGICLGKSTYARTGLVLNCTPLEPGWKGRITIELSNTTELPIRLYPGEGVMQVVFIRGLARCDKSYSDRSGKYQNQSGVQLPFVRS